jgi:hypothetical protein
MSANRQLKARLRRVRKSHVRALTPQLRRERDVFVRARLPRGKFVVVPMTLEARVRGRFWLSVYHSGDGLDVVQGPACQTQEQLGALGSGNSAELEGQELVEAPQSEHKHKSRQGHAQAQAQAQALGEGLDALARSVTDLWAIAKELEQRKLILEEALERRGGFRPAANQ